jgi:hypothetical protein
VRQSEGKDPHVEPERRCVLAAPMRERVIYEVQEPRLAPLGLYGYVITRL